MTSTSIPAGIARCAGCFCAVAFTLASHLAAQTTQPAATPAGAAGEKTIELSPFEVRTDKDTSYGALNSNSITRFSIELDKIPISADIFTAQFMQDVDLVTVDDMLAQYGAGMGITQSAPAAQGPLTQPGDRSNVAGNQSSLGVRGLGAGGIRLNGFVVQATNFNSLSNFNIDRVEVLRGPQGLLYGPGGAGGTVVATTKQARFNQTSAKLHSRIDQYGSKRTLLDANVGNRWMALELTLLNENNQYSRLFFGDRMNGYYGQLAFRLPLRTTLRVDWSHTEQIQISSVQTASKANFGSAANDPRHNYNLPYILYANLVGPTNPVTGQRYPGGAIANGNLSWENVSSFPDGLRHETNNNYNFDTNVDTVWAPWLSTNLAFNYSRLNDHLTGNGGGSINAPLQNGNPFNEWGVTLPPADNFNNRRHINFRISGLVTRDFFHGIAKTQSSFGYDFQRQGFGGTQFGYYLADANGNLAISPTSVTNLGRTAMPSQSWTVGQGPVMQFGPLGHAIYRAQDGKYYVHQELNPRNQAWITPNNPLGLASIRFPGTGVSGNDLPYYDKQITNTGLYFANFTSWWDNRFTTLLGYRYTYTANHIPNDSGVTAIDGPIDTSKEGAPSYNAGADGRVTSWLRWYYSFSANYNYQTQSTDPYGQPVNRSKGQGQEIGLKFTPFGSRASGSLAYYDNKDKGNAASVGNVGSINPVGLNGQYLGSNGPGSGVPENYRARGLELIMTASPKPNWRLRFAATAADGKVSTNASYGILYNDQFYADARGNVTYKDGSAFLVPVDPTAARIASITTTVNPATILTTGVASQQLTTAMMGDPANPYYVWQGGTVAAAGNIRAQSNVGRALQFFNKPNVGTALTGATGLPISAIQYAWPDPNKTHGVVIATQAGQRTVGYPIYRVSLTNSYEISQGPLKGLGAIVSLNNAWKWRTYYYNSLDGSFRLFSRPELGWQINLNPYYEHKFKRIVWRTQMNITNLTNHYVVALLPNDGSGYSTPTNLTATRYGQPRLYAWSNTISF